jgi:hypothetical protein
MRNIMVALLLFYAEFSYANDVSVTLTGQVSSSQAAFIRVGDAFNLTFTYSVDSQGECSGGLSLSFGYRCTGNVVSASAFVGNNTFQYPPSQSFPDPVGDKKSFLQTENEIPNGYRDQFQGSVNFQNTANIVFPIIAFYLQDSSASFFDSVPNMITSWTNGDDGDIKHFDSRTATIYSYANGPEPLAQVNLSPNAIYSPVKPLPPVPLSASAWFFASGLLSFSGLGAVRGSRKI